MAARRKKDYSDRLKNLIKPGFGSIKSTKDKNQEDSIEGYSITPAGVLYAELADMFGNTVSMEKFKEFQSKLLSSLSKLSTNGQHDDLFGEDFNSFYAIYVESINLCGRMKDLLDKNGIEFNPTEGDLDDD